MATKQQIFSILAGASGPMGRLEIEEAVGERYQVFQSQLDRWVKQGLIEDKGEHHYILTDQGREEVLKRGDFKELEHEPGFEEPPKEPVDLAAKEPGLAGELGATQESLATTEYQQFLKLGKTTGVVPLALIKQTADYIWDGGDFRDMVWVAQAMKDMGIRSDLAGRWWNSWRGKMHRPIPSDLPVDFLPRPKTGERADDKKDGAGKRDYILSDDDSPIYVGEGLGDLDYKDALDLSKIRAARGRGDTHTAASPGTMADEVTKIFGAFKEVMGDKTAGKSYVVKTAPDGTGVVEEIEPGKPVLVNQAEGAKPGESFLVDNEGVVKKLEPGAPVVIFKEAPRPAAAGGTHYLVDQATGKMTEVPAGQPIIIMKESTPNQPQLNPIQFTDKDGKPMVLDLSTFIKLEEHRDQQRRDDETHSTKIGIAKAFKDMLKKAGTALGNISGEESK